MKNKIGLVGAGLMGAEIALVFAFAGHDVLLNDRDQASLDRALTRLRTLMEKGVGRGFYTAEGVDPTLARIRTTIDLTAFADRDIVTEAVFETIEVKSAVLKALDGIWGADCLIASNTSTIPISTLAAELWVERRPRFISTHYFSPVSRMKLVEVIPGFDDRCDHRRGDGSDDRDRQDADPRQGYRRFRRQSHAAHVHHRSAQTGRGRRRHARASRHRLSPWPGSSDRPVRTDGRGDVEPVRAGAGDHAGIL
ncbi:3-hydroxyacyl-CoA dehydrogenase NAD-binding domain-containing protein [Sphingomonas sp. MG17]|uniref:3-hydroxyacyl-CoA dehydrogenase NAD-binding domain-containing protein n=1 Tax=Sphingomonas tagetis TaxID=2949092 RepID=A0A9X2HJ25_9SPHN|nr:3-hydroxyacyl-CoA dehydrogenase NAD-binding domain-containing protein [Sphingomonas tagetis]MCP3732106.1 3-hydroxyacyl-CoA dehydrogenase NAD-binding domain-containing protein [Sphingomonas tagetis]